MVENNRPPNHRTISTIPTKGLVRFPDPLPVIGSHALDAISLGRHLPTRRKIRLDSDQHILIFGPNGKGKGTGILMPNLLQMSGSSVVVVDPKGELAAVTAPFRRKLGRVVILNPFGVLADRRGYEDLKGSGFNPLATLDPDLPSFNSQAAALADAMVTVEGSDPHWTQSARALVAAVIMFAVLEKKDPSLGEDFRDPPFLGKNEGAALGTLARVRELVCLASEEKHKGNDYQGYGLPQLALKMMKTGLAGLKNKAAQFTDFTKEVQSIASAAKIQTEAFDDPEIADNLASDETFDFRDLKREPITVYLILPPDMMARHSKWLRLVLTSAIQAVLRPRERGKPKVLFMMDEFFSLGHLEIISTVWALTRGYGVQMMPILQDLPQLKKLYPDMWETFIGMAEAVASFGPNDMTSAEWLSRRMGDTTQAIMSFNSGTNTDAAGNSTTSESYAHSSVKVPLAPPHKLFGLPAGHMVVTFDGHSDAALVEATGYYRIQQCALRARRNPYFHG